MSRVRVSGANTASTAKETILWGAKGSPKHLGFRDPRQAEFASRFDQPPIQIRRFECRLRRHGGRGVSGATVTISRSGRIVISPEPSLTRQSRKLSFGAEAITKVNRSDDGHGNDIDVTYLVKSRSNTNSQPGIETLSFKRLARPDEVECTIMTLCGRMRHKANLLLAASKKYDFKANITEDNCRKALCKLWMAVFPTARAPFPPYVGPPEGTLTVSDASWTALGIPDGSAIDGTMELVRRYASGLYLTLEMLCRSAELRPEAARSLASPRENSRMMLIPTGIIIVEAVMNTLGLKTLQRNDSVDEIIRSTYSLDAPPLLKVGLLDPKPEVAERLCATALMHAGWYATTGSYTASSLATATLEKFQAALESNPRSIDELEVLLLHSNTS